METRANLDDIMRKSLELTRQAQKRSEAKRRKRRPHDAIAKVWVDAMREKFGEDVPVVKWGVVELKLVKALIKEVGLDVAEDVVRYHIAKCETPAVRLMWSIRQNLIIEINRSKHKPGEYYEDEADGAPIEGW